MTHSTKLRYAFARKEMFLKHFFDASARQVNGAGRHYT